MTATSRRHVAAAFDHWHKAAELRQDWLAVGTATEPADREAAEQILTRLYRRHHRDRPRFVWIDSPQQGPALATGVPHHDDLHRWLRPDEPPGRPPIAVDIAAGWSRMMAVLDAGADHPDLAPARAARKGEKPLSHLPPEQALTAGVPLGVVLRRGVRDALRADLMKDLALRARAALDRPPAKVPICWYGQQDAYWIAHYDTLRHLGLAKYPPGAAAQLDDWAALAHATGWWWPGEETCVLVDRPSGTAPLVYRDGWRPS